MDEMHLFYWKRIKHVAVANNIILRKRTIMKKYINILWLIVLLLEPVISHSQESKTTGCVSGNCGNGWGTYIYPDGEYTGEWKDGKQEGHGTYTLNNGDKYEGSWLGGKKSGSGTFTWADRSEEHTSELQ